MVIHSSRPCSFVIHFPHLRHEVPALVLSYVEFLFFDKQSFYTGLRTFEDGNLTPGTDSNYDKVEVIYSIPLHDLRSTLGDVESSHWWESFIHHKPQAFNLPCNAGHFLVNLY